MWPQKAYRQIPGDTHSLSPASKGPVSVRCSFVDFLRETFRRSFSLKLFFMSVAFEQISEKIYPLWERNADKVYFCDREFLRKHTITLCEREIPNKGVFFAAHKYILKVLECPPPPGGTTLHWRIYINNVAVNCKQLYINALGILTITIAQFIVQSLLPCKP